MEGSRRALVAICVVGMIFSGAARVGAQASRPDESASTSFNEITPTLKGAVGLGLIGAEVGILLPSIFKMRETWAYVAFPLALGAGGAAAGYFLLEKNASSPTPSVVALAVGIGAVIPAIIGSLSLAARETGSTGAVQVLPQPSALLNTGQRLFVAIPAVGLGASYTREEIARLHVRPYTEVRVPILSAQF